MPELVSGIHDLDVAHDVPSKSWTPGSAGHDGVDKTLLARFVQPFAAKGCLAVAACATTSLAFGSPAIAR